MGDALVAERSSVFVIGGLDPAIHAELRFIIDHRVKPGGDEDERPSTSTSAYCAAPCIVLTHRPPFALSRRGMGAGDVFALGLCDQRLDAEDFGDARTTGSRSVAALHSGQDDRPPSVSQDANAAMPR